MKRLFRRLPKKLLLAVATAAVVVGVGAVAHAAFGPDRPTKVYQPGVAGFSYPVFDSFTNVPGYGNEEQFFTGSYPGATNVTSPLNQVQNTDVLTLQILVHNGADPSLGAAGTAQNTMVRVALPSSTAQSQEATAYIDSSNTNPQDIFDTLDFAAANGGFFNLTYIPGSAHIRGNYINTALSDNIVTSGDLIGTNALDGNVKGCFQQEVIVTLQVRVNMPEYTLLKQIRLQGQTANDWKKDITSNNGDTVQWSLKFTNSGSTELDQVALLDQLPAGLDVVPGSVVLYSGNYPNGYTFPDSVIQNNGRQVNINLGNYLPLSSGDQQAGQVSAQVIFSTKVDEGSDVCGMPKLVNTAYLTPQGYGAIFDTASTEVDTGNQCKTPTPVFTCDNLDVQQGDNRTVTVTQFNETAQKGATFKDVVISWGDTSSPLMTNNPVGQTHQFANDGTYTISAVAHFMVNGQEQTATSDACAKTVTFATQTAATTTPTTPPAQLVNTGPGDVIGIFGITTVAGAIAHRLFGRRFARR